MKKILIIEDNERVRENIAEILELSNYDVITAEHGKIGVEKAINDQPDLILCDVMMPELDGFGVLYILEKNEATANIPFIFLTAKAEKTDFRKGMNLGADDYITKPFDDLELLNAIERRLKKRAQFSQANTTSNEKTSAFSDKAKGEKALKEFIEKNKVKAFNKKEFIYREGDFPRHLYIVKSGKIKTIKSNDQGKELITRIYYPNDFLGYHALISKTDYTESAIAIEPVEIGTILKEDFEKLLHTHRDLSSKFTKMLADNIQDREEQLIRLAYNSIRKRVAEALVILAENENGKEPKINILREDLANMVGTAKESVIRVLTDFKNDKYIKIEGGAIIILALKKLKDLPN